jgi:hypothetical protein
VEWIWVTNLAYLLIKNKKRFKRGVFFVYLSNI